VLHAAACAASWHDREPVRFRPMAVLYKTGRQRLVNACGPVPMADDPSVRCHFPGSPMKSRIKVLTLAVDDLPRSPAFYREGLGQARRLADGRHASQVGADLSRCQRMVYSPDPPGSKRLRSLQMITQNRCDDSPDAGAHSVRHSAPREPTSWLFKRPRRQDPINARSA
jgi:hypothetical protein